MRADMPVPIWPVFAMIALVLAVLALAFTGRGTAQEVPPDENLLALACDYMKVVAIQENVEIVNCRRAAPDEINGNRAVIHVRVKAETGAFLFTLYFQRSLWSTQGIQAAS